MTTTPTPESLRPTPGAEDLDCAIAAYRISDGPHSHWTEERLSSYRAIISIAKIFAAARRSNAVTQARGRDELIDVLKTLFARGLINTGYRAGVTGDDPWIEWTEVTEARAAIARHEGKAL